MNEDIKIIGGSFGNPRAERTFSGVAKNLFGVWAKQGLMSGYVNTRRIRPGDVLGGCVGLLPLRKAKRPRIRTTWLWQRSTIEKFSERIARIVQSRADCSVFFQIGTHVWFRQKGVRHFCFTDMTVSQAVQTPYFLRNTLSAQGTREAIKAQKEIFDTCEAVFVPSRWAKHSVCADYDIPDNRVFVVGAGASLDGAESTVKPDGLNILFVGRNWQRKGGPILLDVFRKLQQKRPSVTLSVIGTHHHSSFPGVRFFGPLNKRKPAQYARLHNAFTRADVLCVPSLFEPFGLVFLEAQLYAVPPVTFFGEGRDDAIRDGVTGILVRERTPEALYEKLLHLLLDRERIRQMGKAGRAFVKNTYTWQHVAQRILTVMQKFCRSENENGCTAKAAQ